jgi:uncharacterized protein YegL
MKIIKLILVVMALFNISCAKELQGDLTLRKNIVILFDDSGSMMQQGRIYKAQKATISLLKSLKEGTNISIYALNKKRVVELQPVEDGVESAIKKIENIRANGSTPIGKSLTAVTKILERQKEKQSGYGSYTIVIVTDGKANSPKTMFGAVDRAIDNGFIIKTIGLDIHNHKLKNITEFVEASSQRELTKALMRAVDAEVSDDIGFVAQDF